MSYGKVHEIFWEDEKIDTLSDEATLLALFLITGPHRNAIGCFRIGKGALMDLPRFAIWGIEGVSNALQELSNINFIARDERTGWTFITNALKHDPIKGPKAAVHALGLANRVPKNTIVYKQLSEKLSPLLDAEKDTLSGKTGYPMLYPNDGVSAGREKGYAIPYRSPLPLPEPLPEPEHTTTDTESVAARASPEPPDAVVVVDQIVEQAETGKPDPATGLITLFDEMRLETFGEDQARPWPVATDLDSARKIWATTNGDLAKIRHVFETGMQRLKAKAQPPPNSLAYFVTAAENAMVPDIPDQFRRNREPVDATADYLRRRAQRKADEVQRDRDLVRRIQEIPEGGRDEADRRDLAAAQARIQAAEQPAQPEAMEG